MYYNEVSGASLCASKVRRETDPPVQASRTRGAVEEIVETVLLALLVYTAIGLLARSFRVEDVRSEPTTVRVQHVLVGRWLPHAWGCVSAARY